MEWKARNIVLLVLAFCLFTGSVGRAATQRFCAMLSATPASASGEQMEKTGCCSKRKVPVCPKEADWVKAKDCCTTSTVHHKLDIPSSLKFNKVEFKAITLLPVSRFLLIETYPIADFSSWNFYSDTSPPLAGRTLLNRLQTLII